VASTSVAIFEHYGCAHLFKGVVRYIVDGDGICVGTTSTPNTWNDF
jgi:hypothetical protein